MPIVIKIASRLPVPTVRETPIPPKIVRAVDRRSSRKQRPRIPPEPEHSRFDDRVLHEEQQVSRVEKMMMQGYREAPYIAKLLNITGFQCEDYMRRAQARWDIEGGQKKFNEYRGESLYRLRISETRLWAQLDELDSRVRDGKKVPVPTPELVMLLTAIRETSRHRAEMLGLTKERIDRLMDTEEEAALNFKRDADVFARGARVASEMLDLVEARIAKERREAREMKTIEHEPNAQEN